MTLLGSNISVINNDVYNANIYVSEYDAGSQGYVIENNRVMIAPNQDNHEPGIDINSNTKDALVINNRVTNRPTCIRFGAGTSGAYRDNMTYNCTVKYDIPTSGVDNAGNNY